MSKNSLSTLIGQYMSDSETEEEAQNNLSKEVNSLLNEIEDKNGKDSQPTTYWTQCIDPTTGHPYYWNIETKEVTWSKPEEYTKYLELIKSYAPQSVDNCWVVGYSEDSSSKYYVNQYTRVVSWEKPPGFVEDPKNITNKPVSSKPPQKEPSIKSSKSTKRKYPKNLQSDGEDEKIELISSYRGPDDTSSDEESHRKKSKHKTKLKLVAAYTTDSDSETEQNGDEATRIKVGCRKKSDEIEKKEKSVSPALIIEKKDFASIITGGKTEIEKEELEKLKEELEKQTSVPVPAEKTPTCEKSELSFDEKTFQRKRRIEFKTNPIVKQTTKVETHSGLGYVEADSSSASNANEKKNLYMNFQKGNVEFEKPNVGEEENSKSSASNEKEEIMDQYKKDIEEMCDIIEGKVKFLMVGKADITAVQIMDIQFETLLRAFRSKALNTQYFFTWLKETSEDLATLEKNAAPEGWECKWDRQNSQYCYQNLKTGEVQWNFPEEEDSGTTKSSTKPIEVQRGEDEMDISTTPPPNEHEQIHIENRISDYGAWDIDNAPPPPIISMEGLGNGETHKSGDISNELANFYSDIENLSRDAGISNVETETESLDADKQSNKRSCDDSAKKKKKKIKVQGLGSKMKEVSSMVANWQKAQKELDS